MKAILFAAAISAVAFVAVLLLFSQVLTEGETPVGGKPSPKMKLEPWTVVCDKEGHYNFVDEDSYLYPIEEFSDYETALSRCRAIKRLREKLYSETKMTPEERAKIDRIKSRQWEPCPK